MNIINKLTLRQMRLSKRRTVVTMIGITLAVAMITAVSVIVNSAVNYMGKMAEENGNRFHVKFANFQYEDEEIIKDKFTVESSVLAKVIGDYFYDFNENGELVSNEYEYIAENVKIYEQGEDYSTLPMSIRIMAVEDNYYEMMDMELAEGRYPENDSEILITEYFVDYYMDLDMNVGDVISFGDKEYKISGIGSVSGIFGDAEADYESMNLSIPGVLRASPFYTRLDVATLETKDLVSGYYYIDNPSQNVEGVAEDIVEELNQSGVHSTGVVEGDNVWYNSGVGVEYNYDVMMFYGVSEDVVMNMVIDAAKLVLTVIIMTGAVSLIANSFAISISERSRYLGMLASIGATEKQRKSSVYFEGLIEGIVSIPLGILVGIGGMHLAFKLLEPVTMELSGLSYGVEVVVDWSVIVWAVIFSVLTIFVSAYIPAKRASKIPAIEAIRQNRDIKISARNVNNKGIIRRIFGIEGDLALKNLKRNNKRYRITVFSLFVSIVLFMSVYSIVFYMKDQLKHEMELKGYDVRVEYHDYDHDDVYADGLGFDSIFDSITGKMSQSLYAKKVVRYFDNWNTGDIEACINNISEAMYNDEYYQCAKNTGALLGGDYLMLLTMPEEELKEYLEGIDVDYEEFIANEENVILIDGEKLKDMGGISEEYLYIGDKYNESLENIDITIEFGMLSGVSYDIEGNIVDGTKMPEDIAFDARIIGRGQKLMGMIDTPHILITPAMACRIFTEYSGAFRQLAYFTATDDKALEEVYESQRTLAGVDEDNGYSIDNVVDKERSFRNLMSLIEIFVYGFISLITLISVTNIVNTLSTSMALRRSEFAMLKSVGMNQKSFNKMITLEGMFFGIKALVYGLPVGSVVVFGGKFLLEEFGGFVLNIPWEIYIVVIVSVFIVTIITLLGSSGKVKKENIIEGLRNENH